jgi:hypothetical protein
MDRSAVTAGSLGSMLAVLETAAHLDVLVMQARVHAGSGENLTQYGTR